jgi:hypothetical protein
LRKQRRRRKVRVTDLSRNKKGPLITRACSDANTDAEVASFGAPSPEGLMADLPPRPVAFVIVSFSPAQSSISSLLPLGLTAQIEGDMGKLEVQTTHTLKKAWIVANVLTHDAIYLETMAVSDLILVAGLNQAHGWHRLSSEITWSGDVLGERFAEEG